MTQRFVWLRLGDHRADIERAIAACASEHGGVAVGEPTVIARADKTGQQFTSLEASGDWWLAYMRIRGGDWVGPATADQVRDILMPVSRNRPPLSGP